MEKNLNTNSKAKKSKMKWEYFLEVLSRTIDDDIIRYAKKTGKIYISGKCKITGTVKKDIFSKSSILFIEATLYFKEQFTTNAEVRTITRKCNFNEFAEDKATVEVLNQILNEPMEFEIACPVIKTK